MHSSIIQRVQEDFPSYFHTLIRKFLVLQKSNNMRTKNYFRDKNSHKLENTRSIYMLLCTTIIQCHTCYCALMARVCADYLTRSQVPQTRRMVT